MSLATFKRGIHPPERKEYSMDAAIERARVPKILAVPLSQHIGAPTECLVSIGDEVRMGQVLGEAKAFVCAPIHSPVSGKVVGITDYTVESAAFM